MVGEAHLEFQGRRSLTAPVGKVTTALLMLFFASLALYQLPNTRVGFQEVQFPYFVIFLGPLLVLAVLQARAATLRRAWPAFAMVGGLIVATALTGMAHPEQDWLEALKRIGYLITGALVLVVAFHDSRRIEHALIAYMVVAAGMAVYGFVLLTQGFGEAANLFYFGLHYTAATRNGDAYFLVLPLFTALGLATSARQRLARFLGLGVFLVLLLGVLLSLSRGSWLAVFVGLLAFVALAAGRRRYIILPLSVLALAIMVIAPIVVRVPLQQLLADRAASITSTSDALGSSNVVRLRLLDDTAALITANPYLGVGVGKMGQALYSSPEVGLAHAESDYLTMWVEYGPLGIAIVIAMVVWPLRRLWAFQQGSPAVYWRVGLWCGILALGLNSLTNTSLASAYYWILPIALVAVA